MESVQLWIFWSGLFLTAYVYVIYGILVQCILALKKSFNKIQEEKVSITDATLPEVTFIIAAYNEEDCIKEKLENTLSLDYPNDKLNVWLVADGSTDQTVAIANSFNRVKIWHKDQRKGKINAVNRVMPHVNTPITIFTDANTFLNNKAVKALVVPFQNTKVGVVAGEKKVISPESDSAVGAGEGIYWRYESWLKKADSDLNSTMGAAGELFAIKTYLYEKIATNTLIEDFVLSMQIAAKGYKIVYAPDAVAAELPSASIVEEQKRKVRIAAGGIQSVWILRNLLNPFKYGILSFQFISHRALRWTLAPLSLPFIFLSNLWLAINSLNNFYLFTFLSQLLFYTCGILFNYLQEKEIKVKILFVP
ncbi:MAG: glycosyltransferase, partial [Bacteroidota bacterium]